MKQEIKERVERIRNGEVPVGYKKTKVGIIPEKWDVKRLGDIADIDPDNLSNSTNPEYSFQYISLENVDCGILRNTTEILFKNAPSRARRVIIKGDILLSTVRPNLKSHLLLKKKVSNWICSTGFSVVRSKENIAHSGFVYNHLFSNVIGRQIENIIVGSNYPAINTKDVKSLLIPRPSKYNEQEKIAEILSTWDKAIELQEKLIKEHGMLKRGLMQKLFTGKIRFPEFTDEWEEKKIIDILNYEQPNKYITENIVDKDENLTPVLTANKSFILGSTFDENGIYTETPVIIFDDFTIDNKYVDFPFKIRSSAIKILKTKNDNVDIKFVYELMQFIKFPLGEHKRYYISEYQSVKIKIPKHIEQVKIVDVSNILDSELNLLKSELNQLKEQKRGLVQLLLTGIVRVEVD